MPADVPAVTMMPVELLFWLAGSWFAIGCVGCWVLSRVCREASDREASLWRVIRSLLNRCMTLDAAATGKPEFKPLAGALLRAIADERTDDVDPVAAADEAAVLNDLTEQTSVTLDSRL